MKRKRSLLANVFLYSLTAFIMIGANESSGHDWYQTYGGSEYDGGSSVQQTDDGGYIIAGTTGSLGAGASDVYLIKTDASGKELWSRTFGGTDSDWGSSVRQTDDGGYIIAGQTVSFGAGGIDVYLIKTDASGQELWSKTFGGSSNDYGISVGQTDEGGFIIAGNTWSFGAGGIDVYLIKTDASGKELWSKTFGGSSNDYGFAVQQTDDGGYIIAGQTISFGAGGTDVYLIKTDASGKELWSRTFGGLNSDWGYSAQQTDHGGYIVAGSTSSFGEGTNYDVFLTYYMRESREAASKPWLMLLLD